MNLKKKHYILEYENLECFEDDTKYLLEKKTKYRTGVLSFIKENTKLDMNNENAYYTWIMTGVPDGATKEDYIDIASNSEEFDDCLELFDKLFTKYAPDGLFRPSSDEIAFAKRVCERLGLPLIEIYN